MEQGGQDSRQSGQQRRHFRGSQSAGKRARTQSGNLLLWVGPRVDWSGLEALESRPLLCSRVSSQGRKVPRMRTAASQGSDCCASSPCNGDCFKAPIYHIPKLSLQPVVAPKKNKTKLQFQPRNNNVVLAFCGSGTGHLTQTLEIMHKLKKQNFNISGIIMDSDASPKMIEEKILPLNLPTLTLPAIKLVHSEKGVLPIPLVLLSVVHFISKSKETLRDVSRFFAETEPSHIFNFWHITLAHCLQDVQLPTGAEVINVAPQFNIQSQPLAGGPIELIGKGTIDVMAGIFRNSGPTFSISPLAGSNSIPPILELPDPIKSFAPRLILCYFLVQRDAAKLEKLLARYSITGVEFHCFTVKALEKPKDRPLALNSYPKQGKLFKSLLARCTGIIVSTGNETIWEAVCRGVPVLTMPTPGQAEQMMNARIHSNNFPHLVKAVNKITIDDVRWVVDYQPSLESQQESENLRQRVASFDSEGMKTLLNQGN